MSNRDFEAAWNTLGQDHRPPAEKQGKTMLERFKKFMTRDRSRSLVADNLQRFPAALICSVFVALSVSSGANPWIAAVLLPVCWLVGGFAGDAICFLTMEKRRERK